MFTVMLPALFLLPPSAMPGHGPAFAKSLGSRLLGANDPPPAKLLWVGPDGGRWSEATNWSPARLPGPRDIVIFSGQAGVGANTNSVMDLGGVGSYHVGKLMTTGGYSKRITLHNNLWVDVLHLDSNATIAGHKSLTITQRADVPPGNPVATHFATSFWKAGTIGAKLVLYGEKAHKVTLQIGGPAQTVSLDNDFLIADADCTVNWVAGNIIVAAGRTVENKGMFDADSPGGFMGNEGGVGARWTFKNKRDLVKGDGTFKNVQEKKGPGGATYKRVFPR
jgi:hypothetical protein